MTKTKYFCKKCNVELQPLTVCTECGDKGRTISLIINDNIIIHEGIELKHERISYERPVYEYINRWKNKDDPKLKGSVTEIRIIDRKNKLYLQSVTDNENGEIIHQENEDLRKHKK